MADALPAEVAEEIVLTGSVSRGMADEVSDIEMLVVTRDSLELEDCFRLARRRASTGSIPGAHSMGRRGASPATASACPSS